MHNMREIVDAEFINVSDVYCWTPQIIWLCEEFTDPISNLLSCHTLIRATPIHIKHVYDLKIWIIASVLSELGHKNQRERCPRAAGGDATRQ